MTFKQLDFSSLIKDVFGFLFFFEFVSRFFDVSHFLLFVWTFQLWRWIIQCFYTKHLKCYSAFINSIESTSNKRLTLLEEKEPLFLMLRLNMFVIWFYELNKRNPYYRLITSMKIGETDFQQRAIISNHTIFLQRTF